MILPGVQALFGFQMIAVFNGGFRDRLTTDRRLHLLALLLVALTPGLPIAPAAHPRIAEQGRLSERFVVLTSRLIAGALLPLALGLALDVFIVAALILGDRSAGACAGGGTAAVLLLLWFAWPGVRRLRRRRRR